MAYTAKTNWALDNIVLPADMNRIETGIKEAHDGVAAGGKFATPMKLSLAGGATGEVTFDGTQNVTLNVGVSAAGHTHSNVTTSANGMMLSTDKSKLDGIASGATRTIIHNTLTGTSTTEALSAAQGKALKDLVDGKAATSHTHAISDITNLQTELNGKASSSHTQAISTITGLQAALDGKAPTVHAHSVAVKSTNNVGGSHGFMSAQDKEKLDGIQAGAGATVIVENILTSDSIANALSAAQGKALKTLVDGKANSSHTHTTSQITDLTTTLNSYSLTSHNHNTLYAPISHAHTIANITDLQSSLDSKASTTHSHNNVTTSVAGYMSSTDKTKLDGIATGATNTTVVNGLTSDSTTAALSAAQGKVLNTNLEAVSTLAEGRASKDIATTTTDGLMSSADKLKLNGVQAGATNTPVVDTLTSTITTSALSAAQGKALKDLVDGKASTGHSHNLATTSSVGFMSTEDKEKLDGIATGATKTVIINNLNTLSPTSALSAAQGRVLNTNLENLVTSVEGKAGREAVTTTTNGLMSSSDKVKLNGIEAGATKTTLTDIYDGASSSVALSQYGGRSLFSDLKLRGNIRHTAYSGTQYVSQWIESTGASTTNTSVLSNGQSLSINLNTGGYMPAGTIFLSSTLTNYYGLYLDGITRTGGYTINARAINISGGNFNNLEKCEWNIVYSYQRP